MISRVAESCFWLNRYLERVETLGAPARREPSPSSSTSTCRQAERWRPLVIVTGAGGGLPRSASATTAIDDARDRPGATSPGTADNPSSLFASLRAARENARTIRETMSLEMWETLNDLWIWINERDRRRRSTSSDRNAFYVQLRKQCLLFHGIATARCCTRSPFDFMRLGRAVERVGQTARILDVKHHSLGDQGQTSRRARPTPRSGSRSCAPARAFEPFFKRAANTLSGPAVLAFLLFERAFPRSVLHNLDQTRELLAQMRRTDPPGVRRRSWGLADRFRGELLQMCVQDVQHLGVHQLLTRIVDRTSAICTAIHEDYLDPPEEALRHLARVLEPAQRTAIATGSRSAA